MAVTSGTINTSYYDVGDGDTGRYVLDWEITDTSGLVRTISYSVKVEYTGSRLRPYSCFLELEGYNSGTVNTSSITILSAGSYPGGGSTYPKSGTVIATGTFKVTHSSSNAKGGFKGTLHGGMYAWSSNAVTGTASFDTGTLYTACGAPTSVSASGYVTPSGSFTVSWSGASGGTNNTISSYLIYYRVSSDGAAPTTSTYTGTKEVTSTSASGSTTITLSSATRGYKVVCGVVTRGSAGASYYSGIKTGGSVSVNRLPASPTVSTNTTRISSSGTNVVFTVTAGTDADGQSRSLYYATSSSGSKTSFTSPLSKNLSAGATYYFYTFDGYEYSSSTTVSITLNIKPVINSVNASPTLYTALNGTGVTGYQKGYVDIIEPTVTTNKNGTLKTTVEMINSNDTASTTSYGYTYALPDYILTSTSTTLNSYDINTAATNKFSESVRQSTNIKWRLKFVLTDGYEDSDAVYFPSGGEFYAIAHAPSLNASYNQFANSNISGTNSGQVWRNVRMSFYNDSSTPLISVTSTVNGSQLSDVTYTSSTSGNNRYVDIILPDNITSQATINIMASLTNSSASITKKVNCTVTETPTPTMGPLTHAGNVIYPFTDTGTCQISTVWPFPDFTGSTITTAMLQYYNCSTTVANAIKFIHASDTSGSNSVVKTLTWSKSGTDTITANLDKSAAYGWNHELGYTTYAGSKTYYCQFQITNLFGKTYTSDPTTGGWLSRTFNFDETAKNLEIQSVQWAASNTGSTVWNNFTTGSSGNAAQEGMYFKFNLSFGLFTESDITVKLQLENESGINVVASSTYSVGSGLNYATGRTAASNSVSLIYGPVSNISTENSRKWYFQVSSARGTSATTTATTMKVLRQTAPTINFTSCSISPEYAITYSFTQTDTGGGSIQNYLYGDEDLSNALTAPSSGTTWFGTVQSIAQGWDVKSICVKSVSTVSGLISSTKTYYSNYIILYQASPTVAYRKNYIGINTSEPDSSAIVDIHQTSGKNTVLFQGQNSSGEQHRILMDIITGEIKVQVLNGSSWADKHILNMLEGKFY